MIAVVLLNIIFMIVGFRFCYKVGYVHGSRYILLLLSSFKASSTYEVLSFCPGDGDEENQMMFLKNQDPNAEYPLAAVNGPHLIYAFIQGDIVRTNENKELSKAAVCSK